MNISFIFPFILSFFHAFIESDLLHNDRNNFSNQFILQAHTISYHRKQSGSSEFIFLAKILIKYEKTNVKRNSGIQVQTDRTFILSIGSGWVAFTKHK